MCAGDKGCIHQRSLAAAITYPDAVVFQKVFHMKHWVIDSFKICKELKCEKPVFYFTCKQVLGIEMSVVLGS